MTRMPAPRVAQQPPTPPARSKPLSPTEQRILAAAELSGITDRTEQAMLLAQLSAESGHFTRLREGMGYSAKRLRVVFPKYVKTDADAAALAAQGPDAIAERVYGGRMGNTSPGDGARYIGRGYIHLTGKSNYARTGKSVGLDLVGHPELAEDPDHALRIALDFWFANVPRQAAQLGNVLAVTLAINNGTNGLQERRTRFHDYLRRLPPPPDRRARLGAPAPSGGSPYSLLP